MTIEQKQARNRLRRWHSDWRNGEWDGERTPHDYLAEYRNVENAEVCMGGGLWVGNPDPGYWLGDDEAMNFVSWLERVGAIKDDVFPCPPDLAY